MNDAIMKMLQSSVGSQIMEQANIPADKMDDVFNVIGASATEGVMSQVKSGGLSGMMNLFSDNENSGDANQLQSGIQNSIISGLMEKVGLTGDIAQTVAKIAVPALIGTITKKNNETPADDPSPLTDVFGDVLGGSGGAGGMLGGLFK